MIRRSFHRIDEFDDFIDKPGSFIARQNHVFNRFRFKGIGSLKKEKV